MSDSEATTPAETEVAYHSTEDAAQALLARWNSRAEKPTAEDSESESPVPEEPEDEPVAEQADEATADAAQEQPGEVEDLEIDVAGDKFKFPKALSEQAQKIQQKVKDLEAGVTRKFQEAAEIRKQAEAEREYTQFVGKLTTQQTDLVADLRATQRELEQLNGVNVMQLHESDPVAASKVTARLVQLQAVQQRINAQLNQSVEQLRSAETAYRQQIAERGQQQLSKLLPNLTDASKQELASYIAQRQLTPEGKAALWDAEVVAAFHDAKRYRDMMAAKPAAKKPAEPAKTLRPGTAAAPSTNARAKADALKARAFKTGSTEDLAAALFARANLRK